MRHEKGNDGNMFGTLSRGLVTLSRGLVSQSEVLWMSIAHKRYLALKWLLPGPL